VKKCFPRSLQDCTRTFSFFGLGHCSSSVGSIQSLFPEAIASPAEQGGCWGVSGRSDSGILLRVSSVEPFPAAHLHQCEGANSLAPQFIKLCFFVTRCEPVLYINFPKLLHAREITSHRALNSGGKSRLHIRDGHLVLTRQTSKQRVRNLCATDPNEVWDRGLSHEV